MLRVRNLRVAYDSAEILHGIDFDVAAGSLTSIVGPNGSGKSTLLKSITASTRSTGVITLNGINTSQHSRRRLAQLVATLSQARLTPDDMTVAQLVAMGRSPYRSWFQPLSAADHEIVDDAISQAGLENFRDRRLITMSGGEAQRAWTAMTLAQRPTLLLLDEPTTYLDISHQLEVLNLIRRINIERKVTVLMVVHDLNFAGFYSDHVIMLDSGNVAAAGAPTEVLTVERIAKVYRTSVEIDFPTGPDWPRIHTLPAGAEAHLLATGEAGAGSDRAS